MADIKTKLANLEKMITALKQAIDRLEDATPEYVDFVQDSVVSRFKIIIESTWKDLGLFYMN